MKSDRQYFIVKHDLASLIQLPNFIWKSEGVSPDVVPHGYNGVKLGDRWFSFAYTSGDQDAQPLSHVTGFYECVAPARYRKIPRDSGKAWMIEGKECGEQPRIPVGIPPIDVVLGRRTYRSKTLFPITEDEYERIQKVTLARELDPASIPLLQREPRCEQELLVVAAYAYKKLGIREIIRVHKSFPDMLVRIEGHSEEVYLELEMYSRHFILHGHDKQVRNGQFIGDGRPVTVLCWIHDDDRVKNMVHKVYELQSLLRDVERISW